MSAQVCHRAAYVVIDRVPSEIRNQKAEHVALAQAAFLSEFLKGDNFAQGVAAIRGPEFR